MRQNYWPQTGWRWYLPWLTTTELSNAWDGKPRWVARAVWGPTVVHRWSRYKIWAKLSALRGVVCYRLLQPFTARWIAQSRYVYPRWYCWLVE